MNKCKAMLAALAVSLMMMPAPAFAFGHTATPAGERAQSEQAVDNDRAEAANPFSDTNPIPAQSGGFARDGNAKPYRE